MAWLDQFGFEGILENEDGCTAYNPETIYRQQGIEARIGKLQESMKFRFNAVRVKDQNWNALWESGFEPVQVEGILTIRATFHPPSQAPAEIIIDPKMSFGTGHHATTWLMCQAMLSMGFKGKNVLDYGSGTGILAILAATKDAERVDAIDIHESAFVNAKENVELNSAEQVNIYQGTIRNLPPFQYDIILANINRNVILDTFDDIVERTKPGGVMLTSGYYAQDAGLIIDKASTYGLTKTSQKEKDNWQCIAFQKK